MEENRTARICIPVCVRRVREIRPAIIRAAEFADIIELRFDCLTEGEFNDVHYVTVQQFCDSSRPVIFTFRPSEQGGWRELHIGARLSFLFDRCRTLQESENYADIEIDLVGGITHLEQYSARPYMDRVICSHHDLIEVPADLEDIYRQMLASKAGILKIAVQADDITDCIPVMRLLDRARRSGREMIAIAMGDAGILTRILGPSRGAFLTYGSLDKDHSTAPGQISASDLVELYRIRTINKQTEIMGLVGEHVMHSVSPQMHNAAYAASGLNAVYIPFEVRSLDDFVRRMVHTRTRELDWNLRGLSITAPHKSSIMTHLDWIDPIALEIGAVNTVVIQYGELMGYNTDAEAAIGPLKGLIDLEGSRVAVIGAGGAARSLLWSLRKAGARVTVFARDVERRKVTATQFGAECRSLSGATFGEFEIVINATPLGTRGLNEDKSPATASQLRGVNIAYDLVYNPTETRFMREASEAGCQSIGGTQMLVAQAAEQFKLWSGRDAPIDDMRDAALKALRRNERSSQNRV